MVLKSGWSECLYSCILIITNGANHYIYMRLGKEVSLDYDLPSIHSNALLSQYYKLINFLTMSLGSSGPRNNFLLGFPPQSFLNPVD